MLAGIYRDLGDSQSAVALYQGLVDEWGDNPAGRGEIREHFGDLLYKLDRDAEAAEQFAEAGRDLHGVEDLTGELRLLRRRVMALHWAGDPEAAEETMRLAERRHAELPAATAAQPPMIWERALLCLEFARVLSIQSRSAEAVRYLTNGLSVEGRGLSVEGRGLSVEGLNAGGPADQLRSLGDVGTAEQVETLLGTVLRETGEVASAEEVLRRVLDGMDPDARGRREAAYQLSVTLDELGRPEQAQELRRGEGFSKS
jgi:tetratricopeptide (TPR) repeat protein